MGGCAHRVTVPAVRHITVYYCRAGTEQLVPVSFTVNPKLSRSGVENYALTQLFSGPVAGRDAVVLFPPGTAGSVSHEGKTATVNLTGSLAKSFQSGATDEVGMFKSLTFTLTALPDISSVQVLVGGQKLAALPGGHFEIDEPLTRDTFSQ